jgi:cation/acetate symporter
MTSLTPTERDPIAGRAVFAAAAFAAGFGVIAALERVGAPDGLVKALGPLFALAALTVIGLSNRAASLTDFLAARRAIPSLYAGLAFAAALGGVVLTLVSGGDNARPPWLPIAAGVAVAALVVTPAIRAGNASSAIDVLATRFPAFVARAPFAVALFACGLLTANAGFALATQALTAAVDSNTRATAFVVCALGFTLIPGGLKSALWADAACGGGTLLIALFGAALSVAFLPSPLTPLSDDFARFAAESANGRGGALMASAFAAAFAGYFPLLSAALATPSWRDAGRAGVSGLALAALGLAVSAVAMPALAAAPDSAVQTGQALLSAAAWLPSLALARAGTLAASRAVGIDLARGFGRLAVLSSRRIAVGRLTMLAVLSLCAVALTRLPLTPERSLILALAISLAFLAPSLALALALPGRARSATALAALTASLAETAIEATVDPSGFFGSSILEAALIAGGVGLVAGVFAAFAYPSGAKRRDLPASDPFVDMPFDPVDVR